MSTVSPIEIPIPARETTRPRRRAGCLPGCLRVTLGLALVAVVACAGGAYWLTAPPPAVYGELGDPSWPGRSDHDVFTGLRTSYLRDVEPLVRDRCYSCHTGASFRHDLPLIVRLTGFGQSLVDRHMHDGLQALDLGSGFPFARDGRADLVGLPDALGKLEKTVAEGTMPPPSFVDAHPSSALKPDEQDRVLRWVRDAEARLGLRSRVGRTDEERAENLLADRCGHCHGAGSSSLPRDITSRRDLVTQGFVDPVHPDDSRVLAAVVSGRMPKDDTPRLTAAEIGLLGQWTAGRAGNAEAALAAPLGPIEVRRRVLEDLQHLPPGQRRLARYVSADHLASVRRDATGRYEAEDALATALYTASRSPELNPPVDIADGRIYRLLLSDFGWDADTYARVERGYPLAFDPPGEGAAIGDQIRRITGASVDVMALDWLVYTITQPPLYPELVGFPDTLDEFEREHGVDRCLGAKDGRAARAGFRKSGVSLNNRVVERQRDGAYWLSYDFQRSEGPGDVFANPLGPACTGLTPAFQQNGGEVIFELPNGWQGFALVDGQGRRLDVDAPLTIVSNLGTPITNPRSCLDCHANGLLPVHDEVRSATAGDPVLARQVSALYLDDAAMAPDVAQDTDRFRAAKLAGGVSPLRDHDPVGAIAARFAEPADAEELAAFLGVATDGVVRVLRGEAFNRKVLTANFATVVGATGAGRARPADVTLPFDDLDRHAARPDAGVLEPDSGYRLVPVTTPSGAALVGEEVTQGLWRTVLEEDPPIDCLRSLLPSVSVDMRILGEDLPVTCVTPSDAARFANALSARDGLVQAYVTAPGAVAWRAGANGYRLPTLEEFRAAAGTTTFAGADTADEVCSVGNVLGRSDLADLLEVADGRQPFPCDERTRTVGLARVGSFDVAPSGLHDLTGNVAEIVWTAGREQRLELDGPVTLVGGSWLSGPAQAASSAVLVVAPEQRSPEAGFRLARDAGPVAPGPASPGGGRLVARAGNAPGADDERSKEALRALLLLLAVSAQAQGAPDEPIVPDDPDGQDTDDEVVPGGW